MDKITLKINYIFKKHYECKKTLFWHQYSQ